MENLIGKKFTQKKIYDLACWCHEQRLTRQAGLLSADKIERLDSLGFDWDFEMQA